MKNYNLISALLQGKWAIDPKFAMQSLGMVADILSNNIILESEEDDLKQSIVIRGKKANAYSYWNWDNAPEGSVGLIPLMGTLTKNDQWCGPVGMASIGERIKEVERRSNIIGSVLHADTPGGTVDGTETCASIIKGTKKPILGFVDGLCCSGGLWNISGCNEIMASTEMDEIGSVGVLLSFADFQPFYEKEGVKFHTIVSNLSPDKVKMWEDIRNGKYDDYRKEVLDPLAERFQQTIRENLPNVKDEHLTGKVFFAKDLLGTIVNSIGTIEDAIDRVAELADERKGNNLNSNTQTNMKTKQFKFVNSTLSVDNLESVEGSVSLNEDQLEMLNTGLEPNAEAAEELKTVKGDLDAAKDELKTSTERVTELEAEVETLKESAGADPEEIKKKTDGGSEASEEEYISKKGMEIFNAINN